MAMAETRSYFPGRGIWKRIEPKQAGFDPDHLQFAVTQAIESEIKWPHDMNVIIGSIDRPPYNIPLGPVKERGQATGLVVKNGYQVASWGDPERADMTFSATSRFVVSWRARKTAPIPPSPRAFKTSYPGTRGADPAGIGSLSGVIVVGAG